MSKTLQSREDTTVGYARVSTDEQNLELQLDAFKEIGCREVFVEKISGSRSELPQLERAIAAIAPQDTLLVWRFDRVGRSLKHLIDVVARVEGREGHFRSITEDINTTTPSGKLAFHVFGALAEFERDLIRQRTQAGLKAARARGRFGGRPPVMTERKLEIARTMRDALDEDGYPLHPMDEIAETIGVSVSTLYRSFSNKQTSVA